MNKKNWTAIFLVGFIGTVLLFSAKSYAYLDPGSGSYILQLIIAGLVAGSFAIKTFWKTIKNFFAGLFSKKKPK
ncbi:MAG: hypothetical protein HYZ84_03655 [Candidatus Omnitrophica bacterium]|nr:hypothetical protein [Candidatus Omnitrophota bacterium]